VETVKVGLLTSGGDCPGLNAVIRAVVRRATAADVDVIGFHDAWRGVLENSWEPLDVERCRGILPLGGTILGTSRISAGRTPEGIEAARATAARLGLDGYLVIGGDGSLCGAEVVNAAGVPTIGVPKTIDNDIFGTDMTFGFDTAVHVATAAIDRLHTTAESHDRVMVVEVMGRHTGHIAARAGLAGGATVVLVPERPFDIDVVAEHLRHRHSIGRFASIVVVAEGAEPLAGTIERPHRELDRYGHEPLHGIGRVLARAIEAACGFETRVTELGYVQRGGTPTAFDRVLATRMGVAAMELALAGRWGRMATLRCDRIDSVPLAEVVGRTLTLDPEFLDVLATFGSTG
jgi:6-phosphofructokinase 1